MKRIIFLIVLIFCINGLCVFATQVQISDDVKQSIIYRASNNLLYSKWGWNQKDVITQHITNNNGFKRELGVQDVAQGANFENIQYGNIIGLCKIDFKKLDKYIQEDNLNNNIDNVIELLDECFVELKYNDVTLSYMNINEDERISHFIETGILKTEYVKELLDAQKYVDPVMYIIDDNPYIKGIYIKTQTSNNIVIYTDFNSNNNEQFVMYDTVEALSSSDERYIVDYPRIDYKLLEQEKSEQINKLIEEGKQRDVILYSMVGVLSVILVIVIILFIRTIKKS